MKVTRVNEWSQIELGQEDLVRLLIHSGYGAQDFEVVQVAHKLSPREMFTFMDAWSRHLLAATDETAQLVADATEAIRQAHAADAADPGASHGASHGDPGTPS